MQVLSLGGSGGFRFSIPKPLNRSRMFFYWGHLSFCHLATNRWAEGPGFQGSAGVKPRLATILTRTKLISVIVTIHISTTILKTRRTTIRGSRRRRRSSRRRSSSSTSSSRNRRRRRAHDDSNDPNNEVTLLMGAKTARVIMEVHRHNDHSLGLKAGRGDRR